MIISLWSHLNRFTNAKKMVISSGVKKDEEISIYVIAFASNRIVLKN